MSNPHGAGQHFTPAELDLTDCGVENLAVVVGELVLDAASSDGAAKYPTKLPRRIRQVESQDELRGRLSMVIPDQSQPRWTVVRMVVDGDQRFYIMVDRNPLSGLCQLRQAPSAVKRDKFMAVYDEWVNVPPVGLREYFLNSVLQFCNRTASEQKTRNAVGRASSEDLSGEEKNGEENEEEDSLGVKEEDADGDARLLLACTPIAQRHVDLSLDQELGETKVDSDEGCRASLPPTGITTGSSEADPVASQRADLDDSGKLGTLEIAAIGNHENPEAGITQALYFIILLSITRIVLCIEACKTAALGKR